MKRKFLILFLLLSAIVVWPGASCNRTPAPGGPYEGQTFLMNTDNGIKLSFATLDGFMTWELQNHAWIVQTAPEVFVASEIIRTNAPLWRKVVAKAREAYISNPSVTTSNQFYSEAQSFKSQAAMATALKRKAP